MKVAACLGFLGLAALAACAPSERVAPAPQRTGPVVFTRDVAPIVYANCARCHRPGGAGPFALLTYDDVKKRARQIVEVTESRFMPPWLPEPGYVDLQGERRLSDEQITTFAQWHDEGTLEGDPADLPPVPEWPTGWLLGEPDLVVTLPEAYTLPAEGLDVFRNLVMPAPVDRRRWVRTVELRPGNPRLVHHADLRIDRTRSSRMLADLDPEPGFGSMNMGDALAPDGHMITWSPGRDPSAGFDGLAWRLDPQTDLVLQLHMLPAGKPAPILPSIGLYFTDEPPSHTLFSLMLRSREIDIPPGERDYVVEDAYELPVELELLSVFPHAHYLGREVHGYATLPDGKRQWLIRIDDWDFNWQDVYSYTHPIVLPRGSVVHMRYVYDNTADNERNPNRPPRRVVSGSSSADEMGTLAFAALPRSAEDLETLRESLVRQDVKKDPEDWVAHQNLGNLLLTRGDLDGAITHLRRVLDINPTRAHAMDSLGLALARKGDLPAAIEQFRRAIETNPYHAAAHSNLGVTLANAGRAQEAWTHLEKAVELEPRGAQALFNAGTFLMARGRLDEAVTLFGRALEVDPDDATVHNNLGTALANQSRLDEAGRHFRRAVELDPEYAEAHANLATFLVVGGQLDEAIEHYRRALDLGASRAEVEPNLEYALRMKADASR